MPKRVYTGTSYGGSAPKRASIAKAAEQAVSGLVALVTDGVLSALREQGMMAPPHPPREVRCHKCLKMGHVQKDCKAPVRCFRCHGLGHTISVCPSPAVQDLRSKLPAKVGESSKTFEARRGEKSESSSSSEEEEKKTGAGDMEQDTDDLIQQ